MDAILIEENLRKSSNKWFECCTSKFTQKSLQSQIEAFFVPDGLEQKRRDGFNSKRLRVVWKLSAASLTSS